VARAYERQLARQHKPNQRLTTREIDRYCRLGRGGEQMLRRTMLQLHWSARAYHRVLKVARTIADLAGTDNISDANIQEAIQSRRGLRERLR
jgi:magnesium chelatase family protein